MKYLRSDHGKARRLAYEQSPEGRARRNAQGRRFRTTPKFKAFYTNYSQSPKEKARVFEKNNRPERRLYMAKYRTLPEQRASRALRSRLIKQHINRHATPVWADKKAIARIYDAAVDVTRISGVSHVVDHVIPLKHPLVCGLHVEFNLQVLTEKENAQKSNKFLTG